MMSLQVGFNNHNDQPIMADSVVDITAEVKASKQIVLKFCPNNRVQVCVSTGVNSQMNTFIGKNDSIAEINGNNALLHVCSEAGISAEDIYFSMNGNRGNK